MKKVLVGWCILLYLCSCGKVSADGPSFEGRYVGYFHRSGGDTADVSLEFLNGRFEGESALTAYPTIGKGSFLQTDNSITFIDSSLQPPTGSMALSGNFHYEQNIDGTIRIWKEHGPATDEYILKRTIR